MAMAKLIVIRLHPTAPVDGATFTNYLTNLKIQAFALSYSEPSFTPGTAATAEADYNPLDPVVMGGLEVDLGPGPPIPNYSATRPPNAYPAGTRIAQHFDSTNVGFFTVYYPIAVATAVIEVDVPPWQATFDNLHLVVTRGAETLPVDTDHYIVPLDPGPLQTPDQFQGLGTTSFYLAVPPPPAASGVGLSLPADGSPPPFDQLLGAVQNVLGTDPGGALPDLASLTPAECRNIAYEIIWSRQDPLPAAPEGLDQLYNNPPNTGAPSDQHEQDRKQFEGTLANYYATRNAVADRLSRYVYALAAACACEKKSLGQTQALFTFSADPIANPPAGATRVVLTGLGGGDPTANSLGVPAGYFYALGANLPSQITVDQRYRMACGDTTDRDMAAFVNAFDAAVITSVEAFVSLPPGAPIVNPAQAARRLTALAVDAFTTTAHTPLTAALQPILTDWLAYPPSPLPPAAPTWPTYQSSDDDTVFWPNEASAAGKPAAFLSWVLAALTQGYVCPDGQALADKIAAALPAQTITALAQFTTAGWRAFFTALLQAHANNLDFLPPFTKPGNADARIAAFIRAVNQLFAVAPPATPTGYTANVPDMPPTLPKPSTEWIGACLAIYAGLPGGAVVVFGNGFDANQMRAAAAQVLPGDDDAQAWLLDAITAIDALHRLAFSPTVVIAAPQVDTPQLRYSLMEALYARGFTGPQDINPLSQVDFQHALTGTVAYDYAPMLYTAANAAGPGPVVPPGGLVPVNPDGRLTDCIPPPCLSPVGPVAYLSELLKLTEISSCEAPFRATLSLPTSSDTQEGDTLSFFSTTGVVGGMLASDTNIRAGTTVAGTTPTSVKLSQSIAGDVPEKTPITFTAPSLASVLGQRRGPIGSLLASCANLETALPLIDIANECLENVIANITANPPAPAVGTVYNTAADALAGHKLCAEARCDGEPIADAQSCHDPAMLYATLPQYSTPATPVQQQGAYGALKSDFSAPCLPYSQPLDLCRTYLCHLGTDRAQTMRAFRRCITEFALDPSLSTNVFQAQLWRYPLRLEIATETLGLTPEEFAALFGGGTVPVWQLYGFPTAEIGDQSWTQIVVLVSEFLARTGLAYCEFLELWRCRLVPFQNASAEGGSFPDCEPCYTDQLVITFGDTDNIAAPLLQLVTFIRLWRALRRGCCGQRGLTFCELADIAQVLVPITGGLNAEFVRQLAAIMVLHTQFLLPLADPDDRAPGAAGAARMQILALWVGPAAPAWTWAVGELIKHVSRRARREHRCEKRPPEFVKLLRENLDPLSRLAGFDPTSATDHWHQRPTHTLRFAEVLSKIYASDFGVGEILYLFTADQHLDGDDPFPLQERNEALDYPLGLPDGAETHGLWALREQLLRLEDEIDADEIHHWTWGRIVASLTEEFGYAPSGAQDPLSSLGQHFFPHMSHAQSPHAGQYRTPLPGSPPSLWNAPPYGPFHYDAGTTELYIELPLRDAAVIEKLEHVRQLSPQEAQAVQNLYFAPRLDLAAFAFLFPDFAAAERHLIEEPEEDERWSYFRRHFALARARCRLIARHLADHVEAVTRRRHPERVEAAERARLYHESVEAVREQPHFEYAGAVHNRPDPEHTDSVLDRPDSEPTHAASNRRRPEHAAAAGNPGHSAAVDCRSHPARADAAWLVLRHLFADSNRPAAGTPWEDNSGAVPSVTWQPPPSGGAFAALLGLIGTGLLGEFKAAGNAPVWREIRGRTEAFGDTRDETNTPLPTMLPALDLQLSAEELQFINLQNGFALRDRDGLLLGGASGFHVRWSGVLLVDREGEYRFRAGAPTPPGEPPDFERAEHCRWRAVLARGQKTWIVLNHHWSDEEEGETSHLFLRRGAYRITIEFDEPSPDFTRETEIRPRHTGFQLKYIVPNGDGCFEVIPLRHLYRDAAGAVLDDGIAFPDGSRAKQLLHGLYTSSLRDIRRTYQRAFKALLFVHRFRLSAHSATTYRQSELGYMLANADRFKGVAYFRSGGGFIAHAAYFDFNLLPLRDPYLSPPSADDDRVEPSPQRSQALFDWWERDFDYTRVREATRHARARPAWLLFEEAQTEAPGDPSQLLRHIGVDSRHAGLVLHYFDSAGPSVLALGSGDLVDDRWAVRVWHGDAWVRRLLRHFRPVDIAAAQPCLWAADDPSAILAPGAQSGIANLTAFVDDGCFENGPPRRYADVKSLNDELRLRGRDALVAYLCHADRVALPWKAGAFAKDARDLSDLLLVDVKAGVCERASRIDEAITAVQNFIRRARLGLEPSWVVSRAFARLWDRDFTSYRRWQQCKRRTLYKEDWIDWEDLEQARRIEAFRFLETELARSALTIATPGGLEWWPDERPRAHPAVPPEQAIEPSTLRRLEFEGQPGREGLDLMSRQDRDARPRWLAPLSPGDRGSGGGDTVDRPGLRAVVVPPVGLQPLPFWMEAAIRLGRRFWRVAAAGEPPAASGFAPHQIREPGCCSDCDREPEPRVDEFYFWLVDARSYLEPSQAPGIQGMPGGGGSQTATPSGLQYGYQDAYYSQSEQQAELWQDPDVLPQLLDWQPQPAVRLAWCRVHDGEFLQPRYADESVFVTSLKQADLVFQGRSADSLTFSLSNPEPPPPAYTDPSPPGFRYDMAKDEAVALPLLVAAAAPPAGAYPGGLPAYPYFVYVTPGARLFPYALFSPAIAIASTLRMHCHFEAALRWYRLAFDALQSDCTWVSCPRDLPAPPGGNGGDSGRVRIAARSGDGPARDMQGCCQSTGVTPAVARNRAVLLHTFETMRDWADALLRRNAPEPFQQARLLVDTMALVLGRRPHTVLRVEPPNPPQLANFVPAFAPLNPRLMGLYDVVADRRGLIHACLNARRQRYGRLECDIGYFGDEPLRAGWRESVDICAEEGEWCVLPSPYRFTFLIQKALELAGKVRELGAELLAAFEKGDAEYLASLRSVQERDLLELGLAVRQDQWRDADWQIQALQQTKSMHQTNLRYYQTLLDNDLIEDERQYESLTETSISTRATGNAIQAIGEIMKLIPDLFVGFPCEETWVPLGTKLAGVFESAGRIIDIVADVASGTAGLDLTEAGWQRRHDEWQNQKNLLTIEVEQTELQILGAQRRRDQAMRELNTQRRQIEQSTEVMNFLRDKFTAQDLYRFLQKETAAIHFRMHELALHAARQAEHAFNLERGYKTRRFIPDGVWSRLREGLVAGERLEVALRRMEQAYCDENVREYELTKHFSLRLDFPLAYLELRLTGRCEIEIPEWRFDAEHPGMFMRRLRNVSVTIPCVAGPYSGVHCRLTLLSSVTRIDPRLVPLPAECCDGDACRNAYTLQPDDPRVVRLCGARESIATSSGQNDTGMFELNFRDERYLPFEFLGAVSRWRIELPPEDNSFDFNTLTDFVLHLNYTAREGGDLLRKAAREAAECHLPGNGWCLFDVRHDFPEAWQLLRTERRRQQRDDRVTDDRITLDIGREIFPFVPCADQLDITGVLVMFDGAEYDAPGWQMPELAIQWPDEEDEDDLDWKPVHCFASREWPCFYRGVLPFGPVPLQRHRARVRVKLRLHECKEELHRLFVAFRYQVPTRRCGCDPCEREASHTPRHRHADFGSRDYRERYYALEPS
jgi:hypothetical protein